jgi:hypothetical protein
MRKDYHAYTVKSGEHIETRGLGPMQPAPRGDQWISDYEKEIPNPHKGNSTRRVNLEVREPVYPLQTSSISQSKNLSKSFSTTALSSKPTPAKRDVSNKKSFDENMDPVEAEVAWPIDDNQPIQRGHKKFNRITPSSKRIESNDPKDTRDQLKRSLNDASTVLSEERLSSVASSTSSLSNDELTKIARRALDASNMTTSSSIKQESDDYGTTCTSSTNRSTRLAATKAKLSSTQMVPAQKQQDDDEKTVSSVSSARIVRFSAAKKRVQGRKHADDDNADNISVSSNNQKVVRERALKLAAQARLRKIDAERKTQLHSSDSVFDTKPLKDSRGYSSKTMSDEETLILTESLKSASRNDSLPKMKKSITSPMKIEKISLSKSTLVSQPLEEPEERMVLSNDSSRLKIVPTEKQVGKGSANPGNTNQNHASIIPRQPLENNSNLDDVTRKLHRRRAFLSAAERARSVSPLHTEIPVKNPSKSSPVLQTTSTLSSDEDHINDKDTAGLIKGAGSRAPPVNISKLQAIRVESTGSNISDNTPRVKNTSLKIANEKSSAFNQEKRHTDSESNVSSPPSTSLSGISSADSGKLSQVSMRKYSPSLVRETKVQNSEVSPGASAGTCGKEIRKPSVKITVATNSSESKPVIHMSSSTERPSGLSDSRKLEKSISSHNQVSMPLGKPHLNHQDSDPTIQLRIYDQQSAASNGQSYQKSTPLHVTKAPDSKSQQRLSEENRKQDTPVYDRSPLRERLHSFRSRLNASQSVKSDPPEVINRSSSKGAATQHQKVDPPENGSDVCSMEASSTYVGENSVSLTLSKPLASRNAYVEHLQQKKTDQNGRPSPIVMSNPATIALYFKERDFRPERNSEGKQVTNLLEKHDVIPKFSNDPINVDVEVEMDDDDRKSEELLSSPRLSEDSLLAYSESEAGSTFSGFKNTTPCSNPTFSATESGNLEIMEKRKDDYPCVYNADDTDMDESLMKSDDSKLVGQSIIESRYSSEMARMGEGNDCVNNKSNDENTSQISVALQWWQQNYAQTQHESVNKSVEKALSSVSKIEDKSIAKETNPIFGEGYISKKGCNGEVQSQAITGSNNVSISVKDEVKEEKDEASHDEESIFSGLEDNNLAPPTSLKETNLSTELNRDERVNVKSEKTFKRTKHLNPCIPPPPPQKHLGTLLDEIQMMSTVNSDITVSVAANEVLKETISNPLSESIKEEKFGNTKHPVEKEDPFHNASISRSKNDNGENFVSEKIEGNGFKFDGTSEIQPDDETMGSSSIQAAFKRFGDKILDHFDFICRSPGKLVTIFLFSNKVLFLIFFLFRFVSKSKE